MKKACRIIGLLIVLLALIPLWGSHHLYRKTADFIAKARSTEATVVKVEKRGDSYYPLYVYYDNQEREHTKEGLGVQPASHKVGDSREILYDPLRPEEAKFDSFLSLWLLPSILAGIGLIPFTMGMGTALLLPLLMEDIDSSETTHSAVSLSDARVSGSHAPGGIVAGDDRERLWALFAHLGALSFMLGLPFGNIIVPLGIWLAKKDDSPFVDDHGKESLNFQITMMIYFSAAAVLCLVLVGFLLLPLLFIGEIVFIFIAGIKAQSGTTYRYPLTIRMIR